MKTSIPIVICLIYLLAGLLVDVLNYRATMNKYGWGERLWPADKIENKYCGVLGILLWPAFLIVLLLCDFKWLFLSKAAALEKRDREDLRIYGICLGREKARREGRYVSNARRFCSVCGTGIQKSGNCSVCGKQVQQKS